MVGIRQEMAEQTRQRVVTTARRLFAEHGFFATSTTDIVEAAGVGTRGALYGHFANKEELFLAVLEAVETDLGAKVGTQVRSGTPRERFHQALEAFLDASLDPEVRQILLIDGPAVLGWETWREVENQHGLGGLKRLLDEGNADGSLAVEDTETMAHLFLAMINEAAFLIAHAKKPRIARASVGASVAAMMRTLG